MRIETRLVAFLEAQGHLSKTVRPEWKDGEIWIPDVSCSLKDIAAVIPEDWPCQSEIFVLHRDRHVMSIFKGEE